MIAEEADDAAMAVPHDLWIPVLLFVYLCFATHHGTGREYYNGHHLDDVSVCDAVY